VRHSGSSASIRTWSRGICRSSKRWSAIPFSRVFAFTLSEARSKRVSLTYAYRITLTLVISERTITLLDIGSLDEVYRRAR
jgi:hypothetical protein